MNDDSPVIDERRPTLPEYKPGDVDDAVTVSISTTPGEWLVNTVDSVVVPMSMAEVVDALRAGKLSEHSLVWRAGMQEWAPVDRVPQLKLAARLPALAPPPAPSLTPRPTNSTKPPPKPARASSPSNALPAQAIPSRRATLPFGLPAPAAHHARPANPRPSSPRAAPPPVPSQEDAEVLAVYDRPVATISFDLSPPTSTREAVAVPQTLAPTTTDSVERRPPPSQRDLSVVAASQFRRAQSSSKRLVWLSSLASAAAASLLTFWLSRAKPAGEAASSPPAQTEVQAQPSPPGSAMAAPPVVVSPPPSSATEAEAPSTSAAPSAKPKVKYKARPRAARPPRVVVEPSPPAAEPSAEPNPYDVKLDEELPAKAPDSHGSGLEGAGSPESEAGPSSPGF